MNSCKTEKNAFLNRWYHGTTAHYNGYFNAGLKIDGALDTYHNSYKEDYTQILPIFIYPNEKDKSTVKPEMDIAIEKVSVVIAKHSMPTSKVGKPKKNEYNKWIDDNWLVMGQAYFYNRDYKEAIKRFDYIIGMFKDKPIVYDAKLWKAKSFIEQKLFDKATSLLQEIEDDAPYPKGFKKDLNVVQADLLMRQKDYPAAADKLLDAIVLVKKKKTRARLTFILAQMQQKLGDVTGASHYYDEVVKLKPIYEMDFYARIFKALSYSSGSSEDLKKELNAMLKDDKNIDYRDQIFYALADITFKEGDEPQGIDYLKKSTTASVSNDKQKAKSYLRLADLYFLKKDYISSQSYYDSTSAYLSEDYPDYNQIIAKSKRLNELISNLNIIAREDSLQLLAALDSITVVVIINKFIKKIADGRESRKIAEQEALLNSIPTNNTNVNNNGSTWYFYNQAALSFGFNEFHKKFGDRKLEDNWRRKNKAQIIETFDNNANEDDSTSLSTKNDDSLSVDFYYANIPFGDSAMIYSNQRLLNAWYNAGMIYKEQLFDSEEAKYCFEHLVDRFNNSPDAVTAFYQLYRINNDDGHSVESSKYKDIILTRFPDSEAADFINHPKTNEIVNQKIIVDASAYKETYINFLHKNYMTVLTTCNQVIADSVVNTYIDKYYFLKAQIIAHLQKDTAKYVEALQLVVDKFPTEETGKKAKNILDKIHNAIVVNNTTPEKYESNPEAIHYFVLIFPDSSGKVDEMKINFSDFNSKYYSSLQLKTTNYVFDKSNQLIIIKEFKNSTEALDYFQAAKINNVELKKIHKENLQCFVISQENYAAFYKDKSIKDYSLFFNSNYSPQ